MLFLFNIYVSIFANISIIVDNANIGTNTSIIANISINIGDNGINAIILSFNYYLLSINLIYGIHSSYYSILIALSLFNLFLICRVHF